MAVRSVRYSIFLWMLTQLSPFLRHTLASLFTVVVQLPSRVQLFVTPKTTTCQASLAPTISQSLPKFLSIASLMPSSHLILWCPLLLLPSVFPSIRDFSNELAVGIRWPKYRSFSFSNSPSNEYSELIPLRLTGLISLLSKGLSGVSSSTTVQRRWFFCTLPSLWSSSHNWMWPLEDHSLNLTDFFRQSNVSAFQHTV